MNCARSFQTDNYMKTTLIKNLSSNVLQIVMVYMNNIASDYTRYLYSYSYIHLSYFAACIGNCKITNISYTNSLSARILHRAPPGSKWTKIF